MIIRPIRTAEDHAAALARIEELWGADPGTDAGDELDLLVDLVEHYEDRHFPFPEAGPIDILRSHMERRAVPKPTSPGCSVLPRAPRKS